MSAEPTLAADQLEGLGDMDPAAFRAAAHAVVDLMADYLEGVEHYPVLPAIEPGSLRPAFPAMPPDRPESLEAILADYRALVEPNATHWQHPGFLAYFATTASGPGILGEMLTAALGQNAMLWRTSPIGTELEQVVVDWLRQALGLPIGFDGLLTDTASTSSLIALAAAREAAGTDAAERGLGGRDDLGALRVYASAEAHSSIEKACMTLGLGPVRAAPDPDRRSVAMERRRADAASPKTALPAGRSCRLVVATIGTTAPTSVDPVEAIANIAAREGLWLHVDAAYAGPVASCPSAAARSQAGSADSIVVNPHKWLFTPLDASLLLSRRMDQLRAAFSLQPEYLRTLDRETPVRDYNRVPAAARPPLPRAEAVDPDATSAPEGSAAGSPSTSRWPPDSAQGRRGIRDGERLAPVPFSTVCLR